MIAFWVLVVVIAPALIALASAQAVPADAGAIPLHWSGDGQPDRYGSVEEMRAAWMTFGLAVGGVNLMLAVMYVFSDALYDRGLVHGISRQATRPLLAGTSAFLLVLFSIIAFAVTFKTISVL